MTSIQQIVRTELQKIVEKLVPARFAMLQHSIGTALDRAVHIAFNGNSGSSGGGVHATSSGGSSGTGGTGGSDGGLRESIRKAFDRERTPSTKNHYLMDTVNKMRIERQLKSMEGAFEDDDSYTGKNVKDTLALWYRNSHAVGNASNTDQEAQDMIDMLAAYWKVSLKRLVDTVAQIIDQVCKYGGLFATSSAWPASKRVRSARRSARLQGWSSVVLPLQMPACRSIAVTLQSLLWQDLVRSLPALCNELLHRTVAAVETDKELSEFFSVHPFEEQQRKQLEAKFARLRTAKGLLEKLALAGVGDVTTVQLGASGSVEENDPGGLSEGPAGWQFLAAGAGFEVDPACF
jgi:hypothetical protein